MCKRNLVILFGLTALLSFSTSFLGWILPILIKEAGDIALVGWLYFINYLIVFVPGLMSGIFSDIKGRKPPILIGLTIAIAGIFPLLMVVNPFILFIFLICRSIGGIVVSSPLLAMYAESVENRWRARVFAISRMVRLVSMAAGSIILGVIAGWLSIQVALKIILMLWVSAFILSLFLTETRKSVEKRYFSIKLQLLSPLKGASQVILGVGLPLTIIVIVLAIIQPLTSIYLPLHLKEVAGLNLEVLGVFYALCGFIDAISAPLAGYVIDRYGERIGYLIYVITVFISYMLYLHLVGKVYVWIALLPLILNSFDSAFSNTAFLSYTSKITSKENRATVFSAYTIINEVCMIPGPLIGSYLWSINPNLPLLVFASIGLILVPIIMRLK